MNARFTRRGFIRLTAGGAAGAALAVSVPGAVQGLEVLLDPQPPRVPHGPEQWRNGICWMCPAACGLRVRMVGKRAVRIQGNPLHPVNQGGLCPKGLAGLQALYHPERLRKPLRNTGTRDAPKWQTITWAEALHALASRLRHLRDSGRPEAVAILDRQRADLRGRLFRDFLYAYGSPNYLTLSSGTDALRAAALWQQGIDAPLAYDFENTRYVLSLGVDLLEGWASPVSIMRAFGRWRDREDGRNTKFVQVEARYSPTAAQADEWIALRPGTEAAFALGLAYVLITEHLFDADFVREHTFGFEDWKDENGRTRKGFRSLVLSDYRLQRVADITGVAPEAILRVAREFARYRPSIALGDHQNSRLAGDPYAAMAVHSLNALVGSIDVPGGVLVAPEAEAAAPPTSAVARIDAAAARLLPSHDMQALAAAITARTPYGLEMLMLNEVDPLLAEPAAEALRRAFQAVPFIVSFTTFMNDSSATADLVLPAPTGLERWQDGAAPPSFGYQLHAVAAPVVPARHASRDPADVLLGLAKECGGNVHAALPYDDFQGYLRRQAERLYAAQTGAVFAPPVEQAWDRLLQASGWWAPTYSTADQLWEQMLEKGGWWEPTYYFGEWQRICQTESKKFEFYSLALRRRFDRQPASARSREQYADEDVSCLPHQRTLPQPTTEYPLLLMPVETLPLAGGEGGHLPYLQQIAGGHLYAQWESWLEINPQTAARFGIADGDEVWVESPKGKARTRAKFFAGVRPGVVHMPLGYGQRHGPEWACRGANPLTLVGAGAEPLAGIPRSFDTYVRVYRS